MSIPDPVYRRDTGPVSSGTSSSSLISAGRVQGTAVYNTNGDHLGHVEDIMLHKVSGKVAYALMAFGGFLGIGEKYHPVPWSMLKYEIAQEGYVVPLDKHSLKGAPAYDRGEFDYDDAEWRDRVHDYYKAAPYWGL